MIVELPHHRGGEQVQPISADMRFRNQESGIRVAVPGLFCIAELQNKPEMLPDSGFPIPDS